MLLTIAILTSALVILTIKYARKCVEVSELRRALIEADSRAMPRIDADALLAKIKGESL